MSWTTGTQTEALSANTAVSTAFTSGGGTTASIQMVSGAGYAPANFWLPSYGIGKSLLVKASGALSTTTGSNALTIGVTGNTTQGTYNGSAIFATTAAITQTASLTNVPWELEVMINNTATGGSGAYLSNGLMKVYPTTSSVLISRCSSSTNNPNTAVTISTEIAYYIELFALWSTTGNSLTVYNATILGLN